MNLEAQIVAEIEDLKAELARVQTTLVNNPAGESEGDTDGGSPFDFDAPPAVTIDGGGP